MVVLRFLFALQSLRAASCFNQVLGRISQFESCRFSYNGGDQFNNTTTSKSKIHGMSYVQITTMDPLVSREWTVQPTYNHDIGWDRKPKFKPPACRRRRNGDPRQGHKGPSPLTEMAARVVAANIHNFDPLYLNDLSPKALQAILKQLTVHPE